MAEEKPQILVVYGPGAASPTQIVSAASDRWDVSFARAEGDAHATATSGLLSHLGPTYLFDGSADSLASVVEAAGVDGLVTFAERYLALTSSVAWRLGLPSNPPPVVRALTNKVAQRQRLSEAGVDSTPYVEVRSPDDLRRAAGSLGLPMVVKPARGAGSVRTYRIVELDDLSLVEIDDADEPLEGYIAEEELLGVEGELSIVGDYISVEVVTIRGGHWPRVVNGRLPVVSPFREQGAFCPALLGSSETRAAVDLALRALSAVGFQNGLSHVEIKLTPVGPRIIEINGRLGGNVSQLLSRVGGPDLLGDGLNASLLDPEPISKAATQVQGVAFVLAVYSEVSTGTFQSVSGLDEVRALYGVESARLLKRVGDRVDWRDGTHSAVAEVRGWCLSHSAMDVLIAVVKSGVSVDVV